VTAELNAPTDLHPRTETSIFVGYSWMGPRSHLDLVATTIIILPIGIRTRVDRLLASYFMERSIPVQNIHKS